MEVLASILRVIRFDCSTHCRRTLLVVRWYSETGTGRGMATRQPQVAKPILQRRQANSPALRRIDDRYDVPILVDFNRLRCVFVLILFQLSA